ncbi:MAG TPA: butanol dehydrogenase, partial [Ruminococcaceae bacterium]|nr:butanol dehydrogenase [Oscillospiraceae bacterium]
YTGMDALTHAIEAYVSTMHSPFTDPLALQAIKMVFEYLPASYKGDKSAREQMHYAQCLAGMAFSNAMLGIVHSMAHKTGAAYQNGHIPHGCANAMYLPKVIPYNAKIPETRERYASIARAVGLTGDEDNLIQALCRKIDMYNDLLDIPHSIKDYGDGMVPEKEFQEKLHNIAALAISDACTGSNPRQPSQEEMEKLLTACYYDLPVDF